MKYIKTYENQKSPQIGDYVICQDEAYESDSPINIFLSDKIGYIYEIDGKYFNIRYDLNIPLHLLYMFEDIIDKYERFNCFQARRNDIIYFADTKEDLQIYINTKKYNL